MKVLIADDQRMVREGLATIIAGFPDTEVAGVASDGEEALELVAEHSPEVVLMDLRMPRLDGVEATRLLRARHPDVAVVVLTTFADDESILGALSAGASGYLTKDACAKTYGVRSRRRRRDSRCSTLPSNRRSSPRPGTGGGGRRPSPTT